MSRESLRATARVGSTLVAGARVSPVGGAGAPLSSVLLGSVPPPRLETSTPTTMSSATSASGPADSSRRTSGRVRVPTRGGEDIGRGCRSSPAPPMSTRRKPPAKPRKRPAAKKKRPTRAKRSSFAWPTMPQFEQQHYDLIGLGLVALASFLAFVFYIGW